MKFRLFRAAVVSLATLGLVAATAPSAMAAQGTRPCPSFYYCFYDNANYTGWHLNYNTTVSGSFNNPPASSGDRRNQLSSIINNGDRTICIWDDLTARPDKLLVRVAPHQDVPYVGNAVNDKADYWRVYSGNSAC